MTKLHEIYDESGHCIGDEFIDLSGLQHDTKKP